jgi:hypothetical protein
MGLLGNALVAIILVVQMVEKILRLSCHLCNYSFDEIHENKNERPNSMVLWIISCFTLCSNMACLIDE